MNAAVDDDRLNLHESYIFAKQQSELFFYHPFRKTIRTLYQTLLTCQ